MTDTTLTTSTLRVAEQQLCKADDIMAGLVEQHGPCTLSRGPYRPFRRLVHAIINQQISARAGATIEARVHRLVPAFTPSAFLATSTTALRDAGLSGAKTRYIHELARRVADRRLRLHALAQCGDAEVLASLKALPGIGHWTAEMFLLFSLRRPDVLALGDVGLQRAARDLYGEAVSLDTLGETWRPWRSVAAWYLWRHLDG